MIRTLVCILLPFYASAAIQDFSVTSGASKFYDKTADNPIYEIWAGVDATTAGNTCTDPAGTKCNPAAVVKSTTITLSFRSDSSNDGYFIITTDSDDGTVLTVTNDGLISAGQTSTVRITWQDLCSKFSTPTSCDSMTAETFRVGLDSSTTSDPSGDGKLKSGDDYVRVKFGTIPLALLEDASSDASDCSSTTNPGICKYSVYPGDSKVYFILSQATSGMPIVDSIPYRGVRVYYTDTTTTCNAVSANYSHSKATDFTFASTTSATVSDDATITGLSNGTSYCFRTAIVDKAGNISGFYPTASIDEGTASAPVHRATPDEVYGLLEEGNCFIATAAYGNPLENKIDTFRRFRDKVLMKFSLGQKLVQIYYENSKPLAIEIFKYSWAQKLTQVLLWPLWFFTEIWLSYPVVYLFALSGLVFWFSRRRRAC